MDRTKIYSCLDVITWKRTSLFIVKKTVNILYKEIAPSFNFDFVYEYYIYYITITSLK